MKFTKLIVLNLPTMSLVTHKDITRKEASELNFSSVEVLGEKRLVKDRFRQIHRATYLGNIMQTKVKIFFNAKEGQFHLCTTIWLHYGGNVYLKGGIRIPVCAIERIEFCG